MVITEYFLKNKLKESHENKFYLNKGDILTPSAKQILSDRSIEIINVTGNENVQTPKCNDVEEKKENKIIEKLPPFRGTTGEYYYEKGEKFTHLRGNVLVLKNNKRIFLRGKLDNLLGEWILIQKKLINLKNLKLNSDLESIYKSIIKIMVAEIKDALLEEVEILDYSLEKIREISHNPQKFFGIDHLFNINSTFSETILELNRIRTIIRMCELSAVEAFNEEDNKNGDKIVEVLNRMSSAVYIMMLKEKSGTYGNR